MSAPLTDPNALRGSWALVGAMFTGYALLSVAGVVLVKRWLPEARSAVAAGELMSAPVVGAAAGAASYCISFLLWMFVLTKAPLGVAYPIAIGTTLVLVLFASAIVFSERLGLAQLVGVGLVLLGITLIARGLEA